MTGHPLDRPVWTCLTGAQGHLARGGGAAVRIDPDYGPFAAARDASDESQAALAALLHGTDDAFAMQIFTALVGAGLMALLGAWLEFNKRLNRPLSAVTAV